MPQIFQKDPNAILDYTVDWTEWLEDVVDTISSVTWVVPDGLTKVAESNTTLMATIWISGGAVGESYRVVCRMSTATRTEDASIFLEIVEK